MVCSVQHQKDLQHIPPLPLSSITVTLAFKSKRISISRDVKRKRQSRSYTVDSYSLCRFKYKYA